MPDPQPRPPWPRPQVESILELGDWKDCAGGLRVEHELLQPYLVKIDGTQDSVMGLSKLLVVRLLLQAAGEL